MESVKVTETRTERAGDLEKTVTTVREPATDQLRCELIRSATALLMPAQTSGRTREQLGPLSGLAYDFLLREFRATDLTPAIEGYRKVSDEEQAELKEAMAQLRAGELKTLWDVSRDRREGVFSDPDFRVPVGEGGK